MSVQPLSIDGLRTVERPAPRIQRLAIRGLTKRFGDVHALREFDLDVQGGEFISLLGPSGCGKTTALNCLAGLLTADGGHILVDGQDVAATPPERRHFGMVFQNYALFPHLTVGRNIAFGLEMAGLPKAQVGPRVEQVLKLVQLQQHVDKYPAQLSGGQQQRVAIARAVVIEPRLMLMDEPLSNLDAKLRLEMRTEIRRLHQSLGLTTVYVTHDQEEALSLSDRIVVMRFGVIQQIGSPRDVYEEPVNAYVANFLGYRNLLPMRVVACSGGIVEVVSTAGVELRGKARGTFAPGDGVMVAIRPEDVELVGPDGRHANVIAGLVDTAEFLGRDAELSVRTTLGAAMIVRTATIVERDTEVKLYIPEDRLLVFREEVS
ncbi:MAG: ABC transporter ATP-binding protein [Herpetosiphon sp.]